MIRRFAGSGRELDEFLAKVSEDLDSLTDQVAEIGNLVRSQGDKSLVEFTLRYDGAELTEDKLMVSDDEIDEAYNLVDGDFLDALGVAIDNIEDFHFKQMNPSWMEPDADGNIMGQIHRPLERVGIYVPGGTAAYPSSVLMNAIPALVAGVEEIAMVTPPDANGKINPYTLVAAAELGVSEIYKVGGAQAVFALAYGTNTIKPVDKITGPGNIYVTLAKKLVYGEVDIDMLAGPSEILIVADESADPAHVAADLMSQAEHDVRARSILVSYSSDFMDRVEEEIEKQIVTLSRRTIIRESLVQNGAFILVSDLDEAFEIANRVAPEHLEVMVEEPFSWLGAIKNAGAIFLGHYTPEPVGDYLAGPNHILPTGGTAKFYSPVTVATFMKKSSLVYYSRMGFEKNHKEVIRLAEVEGLTAHANSVKVRRRSADGQ
ncbi:MAG: histidinol dehydrogenase [Syntrophomonadaceae bacterium]|nr:histidinol dehydrogenase [Syntrophomonadaceae bacterium]